MAERHQYECLQQLVANIRNFEMPPIDISMYMNSLLEISYRHRVNNAFDTKIWQCMTNLLILKTKLPDLGEVEKTLLQVDPHNNSIYRMLSSLFDRRCMKASFFSDVVKSYTAFWTTSELQKSFELLQDLLLDLTDNTLFKQLCLVINDAFKLCSIDTCPYMLLTYSVCHTLLIYCIHLINMHMLPIAFMQPHKSMFVYRFVFLQHILVLLIECCVMLKCCPHIINYSCTSMLSEMRYSSVRMTNMSAHICYLNSKKILQALSKQKIHKMNQIRIYAASIVQNGLSNGDLDAHNVDRVTKRSLSDLGCLYLLRNKKLATMSNFFYKNCKNGNSTLVNVIEDFKLASEIPSVPILNDVLCYAKIAADIKLHNKFALLLVEKSAYANFLKCQKTNKVNTLNMNVKSSTFQSNRDLCRHLHYHSRFLKQLQLEKFLLDCIQIRHTFSIMYLNSCVCRTKCLQSDEAAGLIKLENNRTVTQCVHCHNVITCNSKQNGGCKISNTNLTHRCKKCGHDIFRQLFLYVCYKNKISSRYVYKYAAVPLQCNEHTYYKSNGENKYLSLCMNGSRKCSNLTTVSDKFGIKNEDVQNIKCMPCSQLTDQAIEQTETCLSQLAYDIKSLQPWHETYMSNIQHYLPIIELMCTGCKLAMLCRCSPYKIGNLPVGFATKQLLLSIGYQILT